MNESVNGKKKQRKQRRKQAKKETKQKGWRVGTGN
jgi:hypothetical protein